MSASIRVEVARDVDAAALRAALAERGLEAREIGGDGELEVRYARDEADRLAEDLSAALEAWISANRLPLVPTRGEGVLALRPPGD